MNVETQTQTIMIDGSLKHDLTTATHNHEDDTTNRKIFDAMKMVKENGNPQIEELLVGSQGMDGVGMPFGLSRSPNLTQDDSIQYPPHSMNNAASYQNYFPPPSSASNLIGNGRNNGLGSMRQLHLAGSFMGRNHLGAHPNSLGSFPMINGSFNSRPEWPPAMMNQEMSPMMPKNNSIQNIMPSVASGNNLPASPRHKKWSLLNQSPSKTHLHPMGLPKDVSSFGNFMQQPHSMMMPTPSAPYLAISQENSNLSIPGMLGDRLHADHVFHTEPEMIGTTSNGPPLGLGNFELGDSWQRNQDTPQPQSHPIYYDHAIFPNHQTTDRAPPKKEKNGRSSQRNQQKSHRRNNGRSEAEENVAPNGSKGNAQANLADLQPHIQELCTDQNGSRKIQQALQCDNRIQREANVQMILDNIDINTVCDDIFGNYVVQRCAEFGNDEQRKHMVMTLGPSIALYSVKMCGCRVIQTIIENADNETNFKLFEWIKNDLVQMVTSQNGNHVVQKAIQNMELKIVDKIAELLSPSCIEFSRHGYGCRVMQRLLERGNPEALAPILVKIMEHASELVSDQYGNYVLQHIASYGRDVEQSMLQDLVFKDFVKYSKGKFASNVVEKCLKNSTIPQESLTDLIKRLNSQSTPNDNIIVQLMTDKFANYVMQALFKCVDIEGKKLLFESVQDHISILADSNHGKHIINLIEASGLIAN